jgi:hypothetical protein
MKPEWQETADKIWATLDRVGERLDRFGERLDRFDDQMERQHAQAQERHAQWELRQAQVELRMDRMEAESKARHARAEARMDRFEKQLIATRNLVRGGVKLVMQIGAAQREAEGEIKELARSQRETGRMLKAFLASMGKGPNGRKAA